MRGSARLLRAEALLLLASAIWGFAFVAQRVGMEYVGPFTFNAVRFALGALFLVPFVVVERRRAPERERRPSGPNRSAVLAGGLIAGSVLFLGASLQQIGVVYTTAGKAGFITGLYVILVPILGLFLGQRPGAEIWIGAATASAGLYFLSVTGRMTVGAGDLLVLCSALFWAIHVLVIGRLVSRGRPIRLATMQFMVCAAFSSVAALATESLAPGALLQAAAPILYAGLLSVGVAYTLQVVAQRDTPPGHTAIILSLETVFAALGGWLVLGETLSARGLIGCALMFAGILVSQVRVARRSGRRPADRVSLRFPPGDEPAAQEGEDIP